jgi:hypothetical protein
MRWAISYSIVPSGQGGGKLPLFPVLAMGRRGLPIKLIGYSEARGNFWSIFIICVSICLLLPQCVPLMRLLFFFTTQKQLMKTDQPTTVLNALQPHIEPASVPDERAPVRCCSRYISNREGQFHYKEALDKDLPIGSGEIESAHRYIIQDRLKIAGAWWDEDNARNILSLRILRANGDWEEYWENN